jgi:type II secretory ATPase GspE/PulE/Tfp pilus assembly ATPase PilB-like protein
MGVDMFERFFGEKGKDKASNPPGKPRLRRPDPSESAQRPHGGLPARRPPEARAQPSPAAPTPVRRTAAQVAERNREAAAQRNMDDDEDYEAGSARKPPQQGMTPLAMRGRRQAGQVSFVPTGAGLNEPDEETLLAINAFAGKVVSANANLNPRQRTYFAAMDNGVWLVAKSDPHSSTVISAKSLVQKSGHRPTTVYHVDLEVIRKIYEAHNKREGIHDVTRDRDVASMQRHVIDLIRGAAAMRCSDIHIIVKQHEAKIRVRTDGVMMNLRELPAAQAFDLCQAAFNMADASDSTYKPMEYQGARITAVKTPNLPDEVQTVRLQFNPLPDGGRYAIMRLLYNQRVGAHEDIDQLGYAEPQIRQIRRMRDLPYGINIISGPTGSGKSTTLQRSLAATLREKRFEVNVVTVEDPPEYEITGAAQLPILNVKTDDERREAFRAAITASLRSDPDIVMIGEIRDGASASLAFQAAMTGHQVWASLHANDAVSVLDRLRDIGVETYKLTDPSLMTGMIGQRLIRRLCDHCKLDWKEGLAQGFLEGERVDAVYTAVGERTAVGKVRFARIGGCPKCSSRGYSGRTVVAETIRPDKKFMDHIAEGRKDMAVAHWLAELNGMSMLEHAMIKMVMSEVDPRDVKDRVGVIDAVDTSRMRWLGQDFKISGIGE